MKCRVSSCTQAAAGLGHYCPAHRNRRLRHGHPEQVTICVRHIRPYFPVIRARIDKNKWSPLWSLLETQWAALITTARDQVEEAKRSPYQRHRKRAAEELININACVPTRTILETAAAMIFMWELQPELFRSDDAFRVQMARRVRFLTDVNAGTYYDHKSGKAKRVYRDLPFKAARCFGQQVIDTLGPACLRMVRLELAERDQAEANANAVQDAIRSLE